MDALLIQPGDGKSVKIGGLGVVFKVSGEATGGLFSIVEHPVESGTLVMPHLHTREDELSYVLEGEIGARIGDQIFQAGPGSYVFKPRGIPHTFWNAGPAPARLIEFISPAGFEKYFAELAELLRSEAAPDRVKISALSTRYEITYDVMDWIPELVAKYGLKAPR